MSTKTSRSIARLLILAVLLISACSPSPTAQAETPTPTPTPTVTVTAEAPESITPTEVSVVEAATSAPTKTPAADPTVTPTPPSSLCSGLTGEIEVQVLVGPSEAVGLEPVAVGAVPFAVATTPPYQVMGSGNIDYQDTLVRDWGSFSVSFDMGITIDGLCREEADGALLDLVLETEGQQNVTVKSEGFTAEYPWAGSHTFDLTFPVEEGATHAGEGWSFVLHLDEG